MPDVDLLRPSPEEAGVSAEALNALYERVRRDIDDGTLGSAQVAVARHGRLAGFETFGRTVMDGVEQPATNETLYNMYSATKGIVSVAVWTLFEDGLLDLDARVSDLIPEFGSGGKDAVTLEQALLHVGGFPRGLIGRGRWETREERLRAMAGWSLEWEPGSRFEYHATSLHWVLAEIIERRTGQDFREYIRQRLIAPLGLEHLYVGLPDDMNPRVAEVRYAEEPVPPPSGWGEVSPDFVLDFNRPEVRAVGVPGAGGVGRAAEMALFYQGLSASGVGPDHLRLLKPETIAWATEVRTTPEHVDAAGVPVSRALGVVVAGDDGLSNQRGLGRSVAPSAFGHPGAGGQVAWLDPVSGISVAYFTDSFVNGIASGRRMTAVSSLAAVCAAEGASSSAR